jgi:hypothetical protein
MNVQTDDIKQQLAAAGVYLYDADKLCKKSPYPEEDDLAMAQVQAITGIGHALIALVECIHDDGGGDIPLVPSKVVH